MEISPIYLQSKMYNTHPSFGTVATGKGKSKVRPDLRMNFSYFDRSQIKKKPRNQHLMKLIEKSDKPVELLFCGCSDGTAVFDTMMELVTAGIPLDKIIINAFDINKDMIEIAQKGRINISNAELIYIYSEYPKNDFWVKELPLLDIPDNDIEFIEQTLHTKYRHSYQFNPELLKYINFYQSDLHTELQKRKQDTDRLISCENVAVYLNNEEEQKKAAELFYRIMKPENLLFVGERDSHCDIVVSDAMFDANFPNCTFEQKKMFWDSGLMSNPNKMVQHVMKLGLKPNMIISPKGCAFEKPYPPEPTMNFYQRK